MNICLFKTDELNKPLSLHDQRGEHLIKILHKKVGDTFTAGVVDGKAGIATITKINDDGITFFFEPKWEGKKLNPLEMIIGIPRPIQLKRLLRDIAALGVCKVHLTGTELGEKSYMKSALVEKGSAYKMLLDGTVQAGSTHVPGFAIHQTLKECLDSISDDSIKFALDNVNPECSLSQAMADANISAAEKISGGENLADGKNFAAEKNFADGKNFAVEKKHVIAAIGSERGWTDKERKLLEDYGYTKCGIGERIMRTETAATVAGAIILSNLKII